jgi:hypothetical protein
MVVMTDNYRAPKQQKESRSKCTYTANWKVSKGLRVDQARHQEENGGRL